MLSTINVNVENNEIVIRAVNGNTTSLTKVSPYVAEFIVRQYFGGHSMINADAGNDNTITFGYNASDDRYGYAFYCDTNGNVFCFFKHYMDQLIENMMFCVHAIDENVF